MNRWTSRLPKYTVIVFLLISSPFLIGILDFSLHGGAYGALYVILNFLPLWIFGGLIDPMVKGFTLYFQNLVAIGILLVFWVVVSFCIGVVLDNLANTSGRE